MRVEAQFEDKSVAAMREERLSLMSSLLVEQEALLFLATDDAARRNDKDHVAAADVAQQASAVAVMLRHHLARLGADIPDRRDLVSRRASAMREVLSRRMRGRPEHQFLSKLQRRLARRLRCDLLDYDQVPLKDILISLSSARALDSNRGAGER